MVDGAENRLGTYPNSSLIGHCSLTIAPLTFAPWWGIILTINVLLPFTYLLVYWIAGLIFEVYFDDPASSFLCIVLKRV